MLIFCGPRPPVAIAKRGLVFGLAISTKSALSGYLDIEEIDEDEETDNDGSINEVIDEADEDGNVDVGSRVGTGRGDDSNGDIVEATNDEGASSDSEDFIDAISNPITVVPCRNRPLLAAALDGCSDAALLLDRDSGDVLHGNEAASDLLARPEMLETSSEEVLGDDNNSLGMGVDIMSLLSLRELGSTWEEVMERLSATTPEVEGGHRFRWSFDAVALTEGADDGVEAPPPVRVRFTCLGDCQCCGIRYLAAYLQSSVSEEEDDTGVERDDGPRMSVILYGGTERRLQRVRATLDAAFDPMFTVDVEGMILLANAAATAKFGYSYEEFIGMNVSKLCGGDHGKKHRGYMKRYLRTGERRIIGKQREVPARRKDGSEFPIELGISEILLPSNTSFEEEEEKDTGLTLFCAYLRDLTDEKERQRVADYECGLLQGMIDASFDPMFQIDSEGTIRRANRAATALFGWSREDFIGRNISMICGGDHARRHDEYLARYLASGEKRVIGKKREVTAKRKDGTEIPIELGVSEVRDPATGKSVFCGYVHDLTRQKLDRKIIKRNEGLIRDRFFLGPNDGQEKARGLDEPSRSRFPSQHDNGIASGEMETMATEEGAAKTTKNGRLSNKRLQRANTSKT